ncbi:cyclase family protein [Spongiivirga citrea]|uniref:Cyclase family protein n=1 Tax=Spongiivirga citrea TaxID=1481457 RepID=A0A6M0CQJ4_9FLAO|nr:cyclase family protein [Spongiivirga citrea]NER18149.1 cyclase family protein [Spongiivirga citrea]
MIADITLRSRKYQIDLLQPIDISIPLRFSKENVTAWNAESPRLKQLLSIENGDPVNFNELTIIPHSHGTHTESLSHVDKSFYSIHDRLKSHFFKTELITVAPEKQGDDFVISKKQLQYHLKNKKPDALVIRTMPNFKDKLTRKYSGENPPYLLENAATFINSQDIKHLLIDLPSVDKEKDGGELSSHKAFWGLPNKPRPEATITEFVYVQNKVEDGSYFLNLQVAPFVNNAAPSKPILYKIIKP